MSGSIPTSEEIRSDGFDLVFRAMCAIANAGRPEEIVAIIRQHILLDADCIILIGSPRELLWIGIEMVLHMLSLSQTQSDARLATFLL